jgi:hypothetical protein
MKLCEPTSLYRPPPGLVKALWRKATEEGRVPSRLLYDRARVIGPGTTPWRGSPPRRSTTH